MERDADGSVWLAVTAFSRSDRWFAHLAGPLVPVAQLLFARHFARALRRAVRAG